MTQTPSDGWADGRGAMHPGFPPPGFWQATDGRWYPPEMAPQQQPPPQPQYAQPQYAQPQYAPAPTPKKKRTVLWVILGLMVLMLGGCTALLVAGAALVGDVDGAVTEAIDSSDLSIETTTIVEEDIASTPDDSELEVVGGEEALDAGGCTRIDSDNITIEVTNNSPKTSSYFLTVGYFDAGGQRLADTTEILNHLRPGERSSETYFLFDVPDGDCEVIEVERFAAESDAGELAEISPCEILGVDALGDVQATVTATNGTPETSDYNVDVAFVNSEGIRVGSGFTFIEAVRTGESAPSEVFSVLDNQSGLTCEVVAVIRNASN